MKKLKRRIVRLTTRRSVTFAEGFQNKQKKIYDVQVDVYRQIDSGSPRFVSPGHGFFQTIEIIYEIKGEEDDAPDRLNHAERTVFDDVSLEKAKDHKGQKEEKQKTAQEAEIGFREIYDSCGHENGKSSCD